MKEIKALRVGEGIFTSEYALPDCLDLIVFEDIDPEGETAKRAIYDMAFICRTLSADESRYLLKHTRAYTVFFVGDFEMNEASAWFFKARMANELKADQLQHFLDHEARNFYPNPYGEKFRPGWIGVSPSYGGKVVRNAGHDMAFKADFGREYSQVMYWKYNIPISTGSAIDFWLEYEKDPGVEIRLRMDLYISGSICDEYRKYEFEGADLDRVITIDHEGPNCFMFVSLYARGMGELKITALHDRYSRRGWGQFLPGGERYVTSGREEIFAYFDPQDMKPPLNVYFSGYKTMESFEGYYMMRAKGCPFLLITDNRLEGGAFYMGSEEYERLFVDVIHKYMDELGFDESQVILSGLSMGTYGALYYGCDIRPHAIILGKPLASIGDVADNERIKRPGGFPTSLDVMHYSVGGTTQDHVEALNDRFWDKFDRTDWGDTKFIVSYMIEDDYDGTAYDTLISHIHDAGARIYGKGLHGRHNDDTTGIVGWFGTQYDRTIEDDFDRGRR